MTLKISKITTKVYHGYQGAFTDQQTRDHMERISMAYDANTETWNESDVSDLKKSHTHLYCKDCYDDTALNLSRSAVKDLNRQRNEAANVFEKNFIWYSFDRRHKL